MVLLGTCNISVHALTISVHTVCYKLEKTLGCYSSSLNFEFEFSIKEGYLLFKGKAVERLFLKTGSKNVSCRPE